MTMQNIPSDKQKYGDDQLVVNHVCAPRHEHERR